MSDLTYNRRNLSLCTYHFPRIRHECLQNIILLTDFSNCLHVNIYHNVNVFNAIGVIVLPPN